MSHDGKEALTRRYDADAPAYAEYWAPILHEPAKRLVTQIPVDGAERVLDIGAGAGTLFAALETRFPAARIVGVDRSAGMLSQTRGSQPVAVMDAADLAFPDRVFDVALMCFVLFHLPDAAAGLREARRVLKPGGTFAATTWGDDIRSRAVDVWNELLEASGAGEISRLANHDQMDTTEKVAGLLETAGFIEGSVEAQDFEYRADREDFLNLRLKVGSSAQRVETLDRQSRAELIDEARRRFAELSDDDFMLRMRIILARALAP